MENLRYKMSDKQIITALECLSKQNSSPADREKCYFMWKEPSCFSCYHEVAQNALALIKELTEENEEKDETIAGLIGTIKDAYGFAVREMKARLEKNLIAIKDHTGKIGLVVLDSDIDQIAKEMLEGEDENT